LRHYFLIKELSQRYAVSLLSMAASRPAAEHVAALAPYTEHVLTFGPAHQGRSRRHKLINRVQLLSQSGEALHQMRATINQLVKKENFDVVISGKRTLPALESLQNLPLIADMCDASSMRLRRSMPYVSPVRLPLLLLEYSQMRRAEQELIARANHSLFISCRDREALLGSTAKRTTIIPNGVDLDFWQRSSRVRGANTIVFTGVMDYRPNVDAALYLIKEILPIVRRSIPDVELLIVGRSPVAQLVNAGQQAGVTVTGFVDDVRPYLERATVFAAPLRFGAGMQNKVLEAMAMELPVVTSSLAADGLRTEEGPPPPLQLAEGPEEFAGQIVQKLIKYHANPAPNAELRRFVATNFAWSRSGAKLGEVIDHVVGGRK
jgi:glycosyltransferase involved in cell wall biosynthesis